MRIALAITNQYPMQLPNGIIYAPIPIHLAIAKGLAQKGHEVTVFCSEDTEIESPMKKVSCYLPSVYSRRQADPENKYLQRYVNTSDGIIFSEMYKMANEGLFEIVLNNDPAQNIHYTKLSKVPTLYTLHDPLNQPPYELLNYYTKYNNHWYVSISNAQRELRPDLKYIRTIYNGLDIAPIPFCETPQDYFVFFGRILKIKGILDNIKVAKQAGVKLKVIGPFYESSPEQKEYCAKVREQFDGEQIEYLGSLDPANLYPIVANAKGFINLIDVHESFGMVLLESMAAGTPVITKRRGAIPEVIEEGRTGYIVETLDEAIEAVKNIDQIDRHYCRQYVADNFSAQRCIDEYDQLIQKIVTEFDYNLSR